MEKRKMQHIRTLGIFAVVLVVSAIAMIGNASGQGGPGGVEPSSPPVPSPPVGPLSKDDGVTTTCVNPGDTITYTICYKNTNKYAVHNVMLVDTLPDEESFVSASDGGTYNAVSHTVTWNIGTLPAGAQGCVTLNVTVKPETSPGTITNSCTIDGDETSPATETEQTDVCSPPPTSTPEPIPEFPAYSLLIPVSCIIALAFIISRRKK